MHSGRWRAYADAVVLALGLNVWVSVAVLPGIFTGAWSGTAATAAAAIVAGGALLPLAVGVWRRSDVLLLFAFPSALLLPSALFPKTVAAHVYGPGRFALVAAGLLGYLAGAALLTARSPRPPERARTLAAAALPLPPRWRRRRRVYRGLVAVVAVFAAALVYTALYGTNRAILRDMFPGRVDPFVTLVTLGALGLWLVLFRWVFVGALAAHRVGDRDLVRRLAALRAEARRARPRPTFYLAVTVALACMAWLLWLRG